MKLPRRRFLHLAAGAAALSLVPRLARAQAYPTRPITMIVPFAAGGPTDVIGRVVAEGMRASLGQPIIIENVTGAGGSIGVGRVARAAPDGYTISIGQWGSHVTNGAIYALPYDLLNDFVPLAWIATGTPLIVSKHTARQELEGIGRLAARRIRTRRHKGLLALEVPSISQASISRKKQLLAFSSCPIAVSHPQCRT